MFVEENEIYSYDIMSILTIDNEINEDIDEYPSGFASSWYAWLWVD